MKTNNIIKLILAILFTELAGYISMLLSGPTSQLYQTLNKPPFSPPGQVFGIVWPILYFLMGVSLHLIYTSPKSKLQEKALDLFLIQLFVNVIWPLFFFRLEMYWLSVGVILLLDILVALTINVFYKVRKVSTYLLIPYIIWILFATYLNIGFAILN